MTWVLRNSACSNCSCAAGVIHVHEHEGAHLQLAMDAAAGLQRKAAAARTHTGKTMLDGIEIEFMPVALHCYTIARNLLRGG